MEEDPGPTTIEVGLDVIPTLGLGTTRLSWMVAWERNETPEPVVALIMTWKFCGSTSLPTTMVTVTFWELFGPLAVNVTVELSSVAEGMPVPENPVGGVTFGVRVRVPWKPARLERFTLNVVDEPS